MSNRRSFLPPLIAALLITPLAAPAAALQEASSPSRTAVVEIVTLTGEVTAIDVPSRMVTLRGPLGGEVSGLVGDDVKNLAQVEVGDLVTIGYYQSIAVSAHRKGEPNPLFVGGDAATAAEGELPAGYASQQTKTTVKVLAVDPEARTLTVEKEDGSLFSTVIHRPEFVQKLQGLRPGDELDVVTTEALIVEVNPAAPGAKPSITDTVSTLVVDSGEIVRRLGNTLLIRNEQGRVVKVVVDPDFEFELDGEKATVFDLKPGTRLHRMAFRVIEDVSYEGD